MIALNYTLSTRGRALHTILVIALIISLAEAFAANRSVKRPSSTSLCAVANPKKRKTKSNVLHVESIIEYKEQVVDEKESISVVRFYSKYCKSCRASEPLFYKLAADFKQPGVKFVEVPLNKDTKVLHDALGVPQLPWTHIYHPDAGLVEERRVSKKFIGEVRECLRCYVYGECDLANAPEGCMEIYGECAIDL